LCLSDITLLVSAKEVLSFSIPECATPYQINPYQSNKSYEQYNICSSPFLLQIGQQSSFA